MSSVRKVRERKTLILESKVWRREEMRRGHKSVEERRINLLDPKS
jgi:hypothetical protein